MWLSENTVKKQSFKAADTGTVTVSGNEPAVFTDSELRSVNIIIPGGFAWKPGIGDETLIIKSGDGRKCAVGKYGNEYINGISAGEVKIFSKGGTIWVKNDGTIAVDGTLQVSGRVEATGGFYKNGTEIIGG